MWPSLAASLLLSKKEIMELKENHQELSHQELAHQMLMIWVSREEATYSQLCNKLKVIPLLQYSKL